jgi:hypothetical protein
MAIFLWSSILVLGGTELAKPAKMRVCNIASSNPSRSPNLIRGWKVAVRIRPLQPTSAVSRFLVLEYARTPTNRAAFLATHGLRNSRSRPAELHREISVVFPGNSRLAEAKTGEWLDLALADWLAVRRSAASFRCSSYPPLAGRSAGATSR